MAYCYRLYSRDGVFKKQIEAEEYTEAKEKLAPEPSDGIFVVEDDGHEVKCGIDWINDVLDNG